MATIFSMMSIVAIVTEHWDHESHPKKIFLSPIELDEFKGIERFDYMKEWEFK